MQRKLLPSGSSIGTSTTVKQPKASPKSRLVSSPEEVKTMISYSCDNATQLALARTCQGLYPPAMKALYRSVTIKNSRSMELFADGLWLHHTGYGSSARILKIKKIQSFEIIVPWDIDPKKIEIVSNMKKLRHLDITYTASGIGDDLRKHFRVTLPKKLPSTLLTCSLKLAGWVNNLRSQHWYIGEATPLLKHPNLKRLDLGGASAVIGTEFFTGNDKARTVLNDLRLYDCDFSSSDLDRILSYPKGLEYLSICSNRHTDGPQNRNHINHSDYFQVIRNSSSGNTLKGLRFDTAYGEHVVVPAPGMHELLGVKYLETSVNHLELPDDVPFELTPIPNIVCPLSCLLPPSLEVIKITPFTYYLQVLRAIVKRKDDDPFFLPRLRKIILVRHYRSQEMTNELVRACSNILHSSQSHILKEFEIKFPPFTDLTSFDTLEITFKAVGVDLVSLFSDDIGKEVLKKGAGQAIWELES